jgi:hypothetical protein
MNHYIGYASLEGWYKVIDTNYQVYAMMTIETKPGQFTRKSSYYITLAQPIDNEVHYCRLLVGFTEWIGNSCVSEKPNLETRVAHMRKAWELIKDWLAGKKLQWHEADIAVPMELRDGLLDGDAEFMGYSAEEGYFKRMRKNGKVKFTFDERSQAPDPRPEPPAPGTL